MNDLFTYWQEYPPTHVLVGSYLMGGHRVRSSRQEKSGYNEIEQTVLSLGGSIGKKLPQGYKVEG